jgi:hypothetical protein
VPSKETACSEAGRGLAADAARLDSRKAIETISIIHFSATARIGTVRRDGLPA